MWRQWGKTNTHIGVDVAAVLQLVQSHSVSGELSLRWAEPGRLCCHLDAPTSPDWPQLDMTPPPWRSSWVLAAPPYGKETHVWNTCICSETKRKMIAHFGFTANIKPQLSKFYTLASCAFEFDMLLFCGLRFVSRWPVRSCYPALD